MLFESLSSYSRGIISTVFSGEERYLERFPEAVNLINQEGEEALYDFALSCVENRLRHRTENAPDPVLQDLAEAKDLLAIQYWAILIVHEYWRSDFGLAEGSDHETNRNSWERYESFSDLEIDAALLHILAQRVPSPFAPKDGQLTFPWAR